MQNTRCTNYKYKQTNNTFHSINTIKALVEEEKGGITYSTQFRAFSRESLDDYYKFDAEILRSESLKKFADKDDLQPMIYADNVCLETLD